MSATLSLMLKLLDPEIKVVIFERLDEVAQESSAAPNNASVAVNIMLEVLETSFPKKMQSIEWQEKLAEMIPFWRKEISAHKEEFREVQAETSKLLKLDVLH